MRRKGRNSRLPFKEISRKRALKEDWKEAITERRLEGDRDAV